MTVSATILPAFKDPDDRARSGIAAPGTAKTHTQGQETRAIQPAVVHLECSGLALFSQIHRATLFNFQIPSLKTKARILNTDSGIGLCS
jgi:hypothetical protein